MLRLGAFGLRSPIGRGAMGEVWSASHVPDGVEVAVKVIHVERAHTARVRQAFAREVQAMARLRHPNVLTLLDIGEVDASAAANSEGALRAGAPFLAMERARCALDVVAERMATFEALREVVLQLLAALGHAHARGVVHRDLKPLNVLVVDEPGGERIKLADFGVAHAFRDALPPRTESGRGSGTPRYMAPEQVVGALREQGPWTDLYALGCLAYWLASGQAPFGGSVMGVFRAHLEAPVPALRPRFAVPEGFEAWLRALLAKRPIDRYRRAADAAHALEALGPAAVAPPVAPGEVARDDEPTQTFELSEWDATTVDEGHRPPRRPLPESATIGRASSTPPRLIGAGLGLYALRPVPMAGRRRERDRLWAALVEVERGGAPRAVVLRGPSGVGKTHLVRWFVERAHELGAAEVLTATHGPMGGPNDGTLDALRRFAKCEDLSVEEREARLHGLLTEGGQPVLGLELRRLTDLLGPAPTTSVRAEDRRSAETHLMAAIAQERPLILWIDDAQWGPDALALAQHLLAESLPVLLVLTVRDDALADRPLEAARLEALHGVAERIDVGPLDEAAHRELIGHLLGLEGELAAEVAARTAGNPLFAVQLVGDWVERGLLEVGEGGFRLPAGAKARLPDGLHAVWSDRVERLVNRLDDEEGARRALEVAAVLGQQLDEAEWRAACEAQGITPPRGLGRALTRAHLAAPRHGDRRHGWSFVHGMLRESLVRSAEESQRLTAHHCACAAMLAARPEGDDPERRAEHLVAAGEPALALAPLLEAAESHSKRGDFDRAIALDDRRDEVVAALGLASDDLRRVLGACRRIRTLCLLGDGAKARSWLEATVAQAEGSSDSALLAELRWTQAAFARHDNDPAAGEQWLREALERYGQLGDALGEARCHKKLGEVLRIAGKLEAAIAHYGWALTAFETLGERFEVAWSQMGLCAAHRQRGELDRAAAFARAGLAHFEEAGEGLGVGHASNELGELARQRRQFDEAATHYARVIEVWGRHRDLDLIRFNLACALLGQGEVDEAGRLLLTLRERAAGRRGLLLYVTAGLCHQAAAAGDWGRCAVHLDEVEPMFDAIPLVDRDLAEAMLRAAEHAAAAGEEALTARFRARAEAQLRALG